MAKVYICIDGEGFCGEGNTLELAHSNYIDNRDDCSVDDLEWYEAERIEVEAKIVKKEVPQKVSPKVSKLAL